MAKTCKYYKMIRQVSYDSGQTWQNLDEYARGELYERDSADCGGISCDPIYQWGVSSSFCVDGDKYVQEKQQVSYDCGKTWEFIESSDTYTHLYKFMDCDCGWVSPYQLGSGYTYDEQCPQCYRVYWEIRCEYGCKYRYTVEQHSSDSGATWEDGSIGNTTLQIDTCECGTLITRNPMTTNDMLYTDNLPTNHAPNTLQCSTNRLDSRNVSGNGITANYVAVGNCIETIDTFTFGYWTRIEKLVLPNTITYIGASQMTKNNMNSFKTVVMLSETPPTMEVIAGHGAFNGKYRDTDIQSPTYGEYVSFEIEKIYVPSTSVDTYKAAEGWNLYADKIIGFTM